MSFLEGVRLFFGAVLILLVPGFAWSFVLFRKRSIDWLERIAISLGLSIAVVPATVFWLHWLLDVSISLLTVSLVATALTFVPAACIAFLRRRSWAHLLAKCSHRRGVADTRRRNQTDTEP